MCHDNTSPTCTRQLSRLHGLIARGRRFGRESAAVERRRRLAAGGVTYDQLDRLVRVQQPNPGTGDHAAPVTQYFYDRLGNYWPVYGVVMASLVAWTLALVIAGPRRHGLHARLAHVRARLPG